jgi:hypothetical protein
MDPIFGQLLSTKSQWLRRVIEDWHLEYHSKEKAFTPSTLVKSADKKCKALQQSNQLHSTADIEIMALTTPELATSVFQALTANPDASRDHNIVGISRYMVQVPSLPPVLGQIYN